MNDTTTPAPAEALPDDPISVVRSDDRAHAYPSTSDVLAGAMILGAEVTPYQLSAILYARVSHLASVADIVDRDAPSTEILDVLIPLISDAQMLSEALEKLCRPSAAERNPQ